MEDIFRQFKKFSGFILEQTGLLKEMAEYNLSLARENNLSLLKYYHHHSEAELLDMGQKNLERFLNQVLGESALKEGFAEIDRWKADKLQLIPHTEISIADLVKVYSMRKQLYLVFLPRYTREVSLFSEIVLELDAFHQKVEQYAYETFVEIQQSEVLARNEELTEKQVEINKAYEQLKEHQHFITALTESIPDIIFIYDIIEDKNIYFNKEIYHVLGYTPEEMITFGSGLLARLTHPEDLHIIQKRNQQYLEMKEGDIADVTFRYKNSKGEYRFVRSKSRVYKLTPEGKPWQVLGTTEDVTDKVQQDVELKRSRDYYLTILDDFPSLIWRSNPEGLCDYFNKTWLAFTGRTFEQEYGNGWAESVHPDDFDHCLHIYRTNLMARTAFKMEYRMKRYDGEYRWIVDYGKPLLDTSGNFTGFLGACFDIQDRKDFEKEIQSKNNKLLSALEELESIQEQLKEANTTLEQRVKDRTEQLTASEKQLRLITDALPTLVSYVNKDEIIQFVNKTYSRWFGLAKEEMEGKPVIEIIGEAVYARMKPLIVEVLSGKEVKTEGKADYKYGGSRNVSSNLIPHIENGEVKGFYVLVYDITEMRNTQQSLEEALSDITLKNAQLTRINNDLDNFIYAASHDLKTPITNMEGLLSILEKGLTEKLDEKELKIFQLMDISMLKLKAAIGYLTDVTRISKNIEEAKEIITIPAIVEEILTNNEELIEELKPLITVSFEVETLEFVKGNFYSIMLNLFTNAIKYRSPERTLEVEIRTYAQENFYVLEVKDNGLGINQQQLPKLFSMFKRFHAHVEGTGIGLYIVKRIVENNGGKIEVSSTEDEGTTFKVYFN